MASVNQNAYTSALPDFRNLGILLRILIFVNVGAIAAAILQAQTLTAAWDTLIEMSAMVQPIVIVTLLALVALSTFLRRLPYYLGAAAVVGIALGVTFLLI